MADVTDVRPPAVGNGTSEREADVVLVREMPPPADPAPLGLAGFALTTFLLSAANANWTHGSAAWLGYAFAYGGAGQLLAGMWEFRNRNVFGATAFSSYGAFWIGLGLWFELVAPHATASQAANDQAWILLAWAIFNFYMMLWSAFVSKAVFAVFFTLQVTEVLLSVANFNNWSNVLKAGGYVGVITALAAWYASSAGVINGVSGRIFLPVGTPLMKAAPQAATLGTDRRPLNR